MTILLKQNSYIMHRGHPDPLPENKIIFCNCCRRQTRHKHAWNGKREDIDESGKDYDGSQFVESTVFATWICLGCETAVLEERYTNDGMRSEDIDIIWSSTFHPPRERFKIRKKHFQNLPSNLDKIYGEILLSLNAEAWLLSAVGLRTLIEGICKNKEIEGANLYTQIDGLNKILPPNIVKNLHSLRFMGNYAAHELTPPAPEELRLALDICEDLLNYLYELDYKSARLGSLTSRYQRK
jgi:hypothetical protein